MDSSSYYYCHSASFFYYDAGDNTTPLNSSNTISVPIRSPDDDDHHHHKELLPFAAAVKIQSAFRGHLVRALVGRIRAVATETDRMQCLIQRQDTVDAVRGDHRERLRVGEGLMALLLRLDSVPGFYPPVRELRRAVSHRIIGLQEILDAIVAVPATADDGFPATAWDEMVRGIWLREDGV